MHVHRNSKKMQSTSYRLCRFILSLLVVAALVPPQYAAAFKYIYIPCDRGLPMEEWELHPKNSDEALGCLTDRLQLWYGKAGTMSSGQLEQFKGHVKMQMKVFLTAKFHHLV
jgi:hypothetical protein